jgi:hypothetical protein
MKKKLNETDITNELRGASLFFQRPATNDNEEDSEPKPRRRTTNPKKRAATVDTAVAEVDAAAEADIEPAPTQPVAPASMTASMASPPLDHELVETIRKNVKRLGKEATFCRFTQEEKNALGDITYTYKRSGIRTSENEVVRIAVNWLLENYRSDGQNSVLAQVLDKLNA